MLLLTCLTTKIVPLLKNIQNNIKCNNLKINVNVNKIDIRPHELY